MLTLNIISLTVLSTLFVRDYRNVPGTQLINVSSCGGCSIVPGAVTCCASRFCVSTFTQGAADFRCAKVLVPAAAATAFGMRANDTAVYDYDAAFVKHHTAEGMAQFLPELYDSDKTPGPVDRETFAFQQFPYAGASSHNQIRR